MVACFYVSSSVQLNISLLTRSLCALSFFVKRLELVYSAAMAFDVFICF